MDFCPTKELNGAYVQENKFIRNHKGYLIGRLTESVSYDSEHIVSKEITVEDAMNVIKKAMIDDEPSEPGSFAHSWHCNIAMMCHDAILAHDDQVDFAHKVGNDAASRFMKLCFGVETSNDVLNK